MDYKELVEDLRKHLPEKIRYGELVGAPWPYNQQGDLVYEDPLFFGVEKAADAIAELLDRAEKAEKQRDDLFNTLVNVCENVRETHGDDSVCGLCEYDGAHIGESGDWYNECPGFETNSCFCMKEVHCKQWGQPFKPYAEAALKGEQDGKETE